LIQIKIVMIMRVQFALLGSAAALPYGAPARRRMPSRNKIAPVPRKG